MDISSAEIRTRNYVTSASPICGVAQNQLERKLLIFFTDLERAECLLKREFGKKLPEFFELHSGVPPQQEASRPQTRTKRFTGYLHAVWAQITSITLFPGRAIQQISGSPGRMGCFVELNGEIAALTADHIFPDKTDWTKKINYNITTEVGNGNSPEAVGQGWLFGSTAQNPIDCAVFKLKKKKVKIGSVSVINETWVKGNEISKALGKTVLLIKDQKSNNKGKVISTTSKFCPPGSNNGGTTFDNVILVENVESEANFGVKGFSGSLVVMEEDVPAGFTRGQALGIYIHTCSAAKHHFVAPFYPCEKEFGISSIHN